MFKTRQRGNALFLILLGIVLLAGLAYAVQQNFQGGNKRLSGTRVEALADDIIMTGAGYEKAVNKMINNGTSESRLSFERVSGDGYALTPAAGDTEKVFGVLGGASQYLDPAKNVLDTTRSAKSGYGTWWFTGMMWAEGVGTDGSDSANKELLAILPWLRKDVCIAINKKLGITNPSGLPPKETSNIRVDVYTGAFSATNVGLGVTGAYTKGFKAGCFEGNTLGSSNTNVAGSYFFYYSLLIR